MIDYLKARLFQGLHKAMRLANPAKSPGPAHLSDLLRLSFQIKYFLEPLPHTDERRLTPPAQGRFQSAGHRPIDEHGIGLSETARRIAEQAARQEGPISEGIGRVDDDKIKIPPEPPVLKSIVEQENARSALNGFFARCHPVFPRIWKNQWKSPG